MTVNNQNRRNGPYLAQPPYPDTGPFTYQFKIIDEPVGIDEGIEVIRTNNQGVSVTLEETTDYTVAGEGDDAGGSVTLIAGLEAGETITCVRKNALTQLLDLVNQGDFSAADVEEALDRMIMVAQQHQELIDRCYKVPIGQIYSAPALEAEYYVTRPALLAETVVSETATTALIIGVTAAQVQAYDYLELEIVDLGGNDVGPVADQIMVQIVVNEVIAIAGYSYAFQTVDSLGAVSSIFGEAQINIKLSPAAEFEIDVFPLGTKGHGRFIFSRAESSVQTGSGSITYKDPVSAEVMLGVRGGMTLVGPGPITGFVVRLVTNPTKTYGHLRLWGLPND
jgi:hypothetical protein